MTPLIYDRLMWAREWAGIPASGKAYKVAGLGMMKVVCLYLHTGAHW